MYSIEYVLNRVCNAYNNPVRMTSNKDIVNKKIKINKIKNKNCPFS